MVLADDISALSACVHKLSDAVGKFVIARLSRGTFRVTPFSDWNTFDKLCNLMSSHMTMEQIARFSLASKVILSYKIDFASSFYDQLAKGLWKKASNGCLYKLDDCERYMYVEINDHFEAYVQQSREKLQNFTVAHEVFDKMSEPTSTPSQESTYPNGVAMTKYTDGGQGSENGEVETSEKILTPKFCSNDEVEEGYRVTREVFDVMQGIQIETSDVVEAENGQDDTQASVHQVFDELSQPILNSNALVLPAPDAIGELQEGSNEDVEQMTDCRIIDEGQALVVNVFGGELVSKPIEDPIAQVADHIEDIASEYSGQSIYESSSIIVSEECHESLDHRRQMFAKLATLDDSLFQDLTFVLVCRGRFGTLNRVLLDVRQLSHQILQIEFVISAGNFRPDYELFPGHLVKVNLTSQGLNSRLSCNLVDNSLTELTPPIFIYDPGDTIHLILTSAIVFNSTTTILGVRTMTGDVQIFDPGIISVPLLFCCFTLEDKGVFRGEDDKVYVVYTWELCNVVALWCKRVPCLFCVFAIKVPNAKIISEHRVIEVGLVGFRGQQALGRNNVNWILYDALMARNEDTVLLEFLCGAEGLISYSNMGISIDEDMNHKILLLLAGTFLGSTIRVYTLSHEICGLPVWVFDPGGIDGFPKGKNWCAKRALGESIKMRTVRNCELSDAVIHIFDPGGLHCQCDCPYFRGSLNSEGIVNYQARKVHLLGTMLKEEWSIVRGASPIFSVVDCVKSISPSFEALLRVTLARLCTTLSVFGSSLHPNQNQMQFYDSNLLDQSTDPRFCALPHELRQVATFAEIVQAIVKIVRLAWSLGGVIVADFRLEWRLPQLLEYGLCIYDDTIFVFDPGGLQTYLQVFRFPLLNDTLLSWIHGSTCDP